MIEAKAGKWYLHKKTGGYYFLQAIGSIESTLEKVAIYRSRKTNDYWVRPIAEFSDGRFEAVPEENGIVQFRMSDEELKKLAADIMDGSM
jgi:hypothetical protein